jgi:CubicO group peptidase (beta-lactamase class C family)
LQVQPRTTAEVVRLANASDLIFAPGSRYGYSSGGYAILAAVAEKAAGMSYEELVRKYVAAPLNARSLRHANRQTALVGRALPVLFTGTGVVNGPLRDLSFLVGGGSVYSTARDFLAVAEAYQREAYGALAARAFVDSSGFAWSGSTAGYRSFADWHRADSITVVFLANMNTGAIEMLRRDIPRLLRGERVTPSLPHVRAVELNADTRAKLEGQYETGTGSFTRLRFLTPSAALFGERVLVAMSDSVLFNFGEYSMARILRSPSGEISGLRFEFVSPSGQTGSVTFPRQSR